MRFYLPAIASLCCMMPMRDSLSAPPGAPPAVPVAPPAADGFAAEAAARHAKRTTCLKEARARKLVGANKTAYIKECLARGKP